MTISDAAMSSVSVGVAGGKGVVGVGDECVGMMGLAENGVLT